jgi:arylsulfatase A-like enzyme
MIISWPGKVRGGTTSSVPVMSTDFLPTMLEMAGLPPRPRTHQDGVSLVPLLTETGRIGRDALFWHFPHYHGSGNRPSGAIRMGPWKLVEWFEDGAVELYDLAVDPGEERDLASSEPDRVREMLTRLRAWRREVGANMPREDP